MRLLTQKESVWLTEDRLRDSKWFLNRRLLSSITFSWSAICLLPNIYLSICKGAENWGLGRPSLALAVDFGCLPLPPSPAFCLGVGRGNSPFKWPQSFPPQLHAFKEQVYNLWVFLSVSFSSRKQLPHWSHVNFPVSFRREGFKRPFRHLWWCGFATYASSWASVPDANLHITIISTIYVFAGQHSRTM